MLELFYYFSSCDVCLFVWTCVRVSLFFTFIATRRKINLNSYHRNRNGCCADRNCWAAILCFSYSAFATVLARTVPPWPNSSSLDRNHYSGGIITALAVTVTPLYRKRFSSTSSRNALRLVVLRDAIPRDDVVASIREQRVGMSRMSSSAVSVLVTWRPIPFSSVRGRRFRGAVMISVNWPPMRGDFPRDASRLGRVWIYFTRDG